MFIPRLYPRRNPLRFLLWKLLLRKNGKFMAGLEGYFFGPSHGLNDYDTLVNYKKSHVKPDKQYSILPTVLAIAGNTDGRTIIDLGCGTGFFTLPFAEKATCVYGIDNSAVQLSFAIQHPNVVYLKKDIFVDPLPLSDVIIAPFVVNYATTVPILRHLFQKLYSSLSVEGKLVIVVDLPNNKELQQFGASKKTLGAIADESALQVDIFSGKEKICTLNAVYFTPQTIEQTLRLVGFKDITWHRPIISEEGVSLM